MENYTKEGLKQALQVVSEGLNPDKVVKSYGYYTSLYSEDTNEEDLAAAAIKHPELHPFMVDVVEKIIHLTSTGKVYDLWVHDEEQAGSPITRELVLHDEKYCDLFARCLLHQDLNHEVMQNDYIKEIIDKWGINENTAKILNARIENVGQWGFDLIEELHEEYPEELSEFIDMEEMD